MSEDAAAYGQAINTWDDFARDCREQRLTAARRPLIRTKRYEVFLNYQHYKDQEAEWERIQLEVGGAKLDLKQALELRDMLVRLLPEGTT